jgi:hypothetical protein
MNRPENTGQKQAGRFQKGQSGNPRQGKMNNLFDDRQCANHANENISYWGGCPICGGNDGCMTDSGRNHWYHCRTHRTKWCVGINLFSVDYLSPQNLLANEYRLRHYEAVTPVSSYNPLYSRLDRECP